MRVLVALFALLATGCCVPGNFGESGDSAVVCFDHDGDGVETCLGARGDCNDTSPNVTQVWLGPETCNGVDDDCDGVVDDGVGFRPDEDHDGHGDDSVVRCRAQSGDVQTWDDCDDTNADVYEGHAELCDGIDNNCNDYADEHVVLYPDVDGDGFGDTDLPSCEDGTTSVGGDCDDADAAVNPNAAERCNGADDDCDGTVDGSATLWVDADGDTWGVEPTAEVDACSAGYSAQLGDCDDADAAAYPGALETCEDAYDKNCDGSVGSDDADHDGSPACEDCDDSAWFIYPGAIETCGNALDDNCDGQVDEGC